MKLKTIGNDDQVERKKWSAQRAIGACDRHIRKERHQRARSGVAINWQVGDPTGNGCLGQAGDARHREERHEHACGGVAIDWQVAAPAARWIALNG